MKRIVDQKRSNISPVTLLHLPFKTVLERYRQIDLNLHNQNKEESV